MLTFTGPTWGTFTVSPVRTTTGRLLIECTIIGSKHSYCITISRWIMERRLGRIVPV
jgi:hypothetical protein